MTSYFVQSPFSCSQLVILLSKSARICIRHCLLMPETTPNTSVDPHSTSSHRCSHSNITHFTPSGDRLRAVTFCSHLFVRLSCSHAACTDLPWSLSSPQHMPPHLPQPPLEAHCLGSCTAHAHRRAPHSEAARDRVAGAGALGPVRARCLSGDSRVMVRVAWRGPWNCAVCVGATLLTCLVSKACAPCVRVGTGRDTTMVLTY